MSGTSGSGEPGKVTGKTGEGDFFSTMLAMQGSTGTASNNQDQQGNQLPPTGMDQVPDQIPAGQSAKPLKPSKDEASNQTADNSQPQIPLPGIDPAMQIMQSLVANNGLSLSPEGKNVVQGKTAGNTGIGSNSQPNSAVGAVQNALSIPGRGIGSEPALNSQASTQPTVLPEVPAIVAGQNSETPVMVQAYPAPATPLTDQQQQTTAVTNGYGLPLQSNDQSRSDSNNANGISSSANMVAKQVLTVIPGDNLYSGNQNNVLPGNTGVLSGSAASPKLVSADNNAAQSTAIGQQDIGKTLPAPTVAAGSQSVAVNNQVWAENVSLSQAAATPSLIKKDGNQTGDTVHMNNVAPSGSNQPDAGTLVGKITGTTGSTNQDNLFNRQSDDFNGNTPFTGLMTAANVQPNTGANLKQVETVPVAQLPAKLQEIIQNVVVNRGPDYTNVHLKLEPADLGEVTLNLTYTKGELTAQFVASSDHAKNVLDAAMPQLRDALNSQNIKLNDVSVFTGSDINWSGNGNGQQFGQSAGDGWSGQANSHNYSSWQFEGDESLPAVPVTMVNSTDSNNGLNVLV